MGMGDVISRLSVWMTIETSAFEKGADISEKRLNQMTREFTKFGDKLTDIGAAMTKAITLPIAGAGAAVLKFGGDFESAMIKVGISTQASAGELRLMSDLALNLGKDSTFGASEAANAMDELAKSGLSARDILGGAAKAAIDLASATGSELSPAATAITDVMQQFGLSTAQLPAAVDQVTGAVNQSKLDFADYALAIGQAGGVAGSLGVEFEDFNTALAGTSALFASGSDAGTSFKTFLTSLSGNSKEAKEAIAAFGLQFYDTNGALRSMAEIAEELQKKLGGLSEQAKAEVLKDIFGTDAMRTAIGLMDQGAAGLDKIAAAIRNTDAAAQAEERMKGFYGQLEQLKGSIETLAIRIGQSGVLDAVTALTTRVGEFIDWLSKASPTVLRFGALIAGLAAVVGPTTYAIGLITSSLAPLLTMLTARIIPALIAFGWQLTAIATMSGPAAAGLRLLTVALRGLLIATGVGVAIVALTAALDYLIFGTKEATKAERAAEMQATATAAALDTERKATDELSAAKGKEREATLAAMKASRARAAQSLATAAALIKEARASLALAQADSNRRIREATQSSRGAGGGTDPAMVELGRRGRVIDPAAALLADAEERFAKANGMLDGLDRAIAAATPVALPNFAAGPSGTGGDERSGGRGSNRREAEDRKARIAAQVQDEIDALNVDIMQTRASLSNSAEDRAVADLAALKADRAAYDRQIALDEDIKPEQRISLAAIRDSADSEKRRAILIQAAEGLAKERFDRESAANALEMETVSAQGRVQDRTAGEKRMTALRLIDLEFSQREAAAMQDYNDATRRGDETAAAIAKSKLARIELLKQFATEEAKLQTMSPLQAYLDQIPRTATEINEAFEGVAVSGLQSLNDGIVDAIVNFKSLGNVFSSVAKQIIADLLRIQIQKALIEPLSKFLSGSSGNSGGDGLLGSILKIGNAAGGIKGIGKNANGTSFWRGGLTMVGERGPELVDLPRGSRVTPNNEIGGRGAQQVEIFDTTGLFRFRVDGQIMEAAPSIAKLGSGMGQSAIQRSNTRRVG